MLLGVLTVVVGLVAVVLTVMAEVVLVVNSGSRGNTVGVDRDGKDGVGSYDIRGKNGVGNLNNGGKGGVGNVDSSGGGVDRVNKYVSAVSGGGRSVSVGSGGEEVVILVLTLVESQGIGGVDRSDFDNHELGFRPFQCRLRGTMKYPRAFTPSAITVNVSHFEQ